MRRKTGQHILPTLSTSSSASSPTSSSPAYSASTSPASQAPASDSSSYAPSCASESALARQAQCLGSYAHTLCKRVGLRKWQYARTGCDTSWRDHNYDDDDDDDDAENDGNGNEAGDGVSTERVAWTSANQTTTQRLTETCKTNNRRRVEKYPRDASRKPQRNSTCYNNHGQAPDVARLDAQLFDLQSSVRLDEDQSGATIATQTQRTFHAHT